MPYIPGFEDHDPLAWMNPDARKRFDKWEEGHKAQKERIRSRSISDFWTGGIERAKGGDSDLDRALRLSGVLKATSNYVRILTNDPTIKVYYSSGDRSYTDGKSVVISANVEEKSIDVITGTCLHEAAHCVITPIQEVNDILGDPGAGTVPLFGPVSAMKEWLTEKALQDDVSERQIHKNLFTIINAIEDRRIDRWVYDTAPGYRGYYDKLYDYHWNSTKIEQELLVGWRAPAWQSYIARLINISNPYAHLTRGMLPGVSEMYDMVDLKNISRWNHLSKKDMAEVLVGMAVDIHKLIVVSILEQKVDDPKFDSPNKCLLNAFPTPSKKPSQGGNEDNDEEGEESLEDVLADMFGEDSDEMRDLLKSMKEKEEKTQKHMPNMDPSDTGDDNGSLDDADDSKKQSASSEPGEIDLDNPTQQDKGGQPQVGYEYGDDDLENQINFTNGHEGEEEKTPISVEDGGLVEALKEADTKVTDASGQVDWVEGTPVGKVRVLSVGKVTKGLIQTGAFADYGLSEKIGFNHDDWFAEGRRWGARMVREIQVRNENKLEKFTRRSRGRLDRNLLSGLGYGNEQVFFNQQLTAYRPTFVHLSLDTSSSMWGKKWEQTFKLAVALGYASTKIDNLDVVISTRNYVGSYPAIFTAFDSRRNTIKDLDLLKHFNPAGWTPEGLVFDSIIDQMNLVPAEYVKYFINICDGFPYAHGDGWTYAPDNALHQTRRAYRTMKELGTNVWSFYVGTSDKPDPTEWEFFNTMYSPDATYIVPGNLRKIISDLNTFLKSDDEKVTQ